MTTKRKPAKKTPAVTKLTSTEVKAIKSRLWFGETRLEVSEDLGISLGLVCNIGSGHRWPKIPWPDGSTYAMPQDRIEAIQLAREKVRPLMLEEVKKILQRRGKKA